MTEQDALDYDFTVFQGNTFRKKYTMEYTDSEGVVTPYDLTGKTFRGEIKATYYSSVAAEFIITSEIGESTVLDTLVLELTAETTAALCAQEYVYDVEMVEANGEVSKLLAGKFLVNPEVTK